MPLGFVVAWTGSTGEILLDLASEVEWSTPGHCHRYMRITTALFQHQDAVRGNHYSSKNARPLFCSSVDPGITI
jgi:hypothetical protein